MTTSGAPVLIVEGEMKEEQSLYRQSIDAFAGIIVFCLRVVLVVLILRLMDVIP